MGWSLSIQLEKVMDVCKSLLKEIIPWFGLPNSLQSENGPSLYYKESWAPKTDAFELWCWRRLLRVLWTARRANQSILKEISPEYLLKGLMLKLKLQYFGHLCEERTHLKRPWCWERLQAGGEGYDRGWDGWMASPTQRTWVWVNSRSWLWTGKPGVLQPMGLQRVRQS